MNFPQRANDNFTALRTGIGHNAIFDLHSGKKSGFQCYDFDAISTPEVLED
jgi:hypothetical protein